MLERLDSVVANYDEKEERQQEGQFCGMIELFTSGAPASGRRSLCHFLTRVTKSHLHDNAMSRASVGLLTVNYSTLSLGEHSRTMSNSLWQNISLRFVK